MSGSICVYRCQADVEDDMELGRWRAVSAVVLMAAGLFGAHGCSGKHRPFGVVDDGAEVVDGAQQGMGSLPPNDDYSDAVGRSTDEDGLTDPIDLVPTGSLGSTCAIDSGCNSGFCVAGRCCESACDGVCEACSEGGRCQVAPSDDARCPVIDCAEAANSCATFAETQATDRCQSVGVCKTSCDPLTVAIDTACNEVAPGIEGVCNEAGNCIDPRSGLGGPCQSNIDCIDGTCVDGICCREACNGTCEICDAIGNCVAEPGGTSCGDGLECFGRGACRAPAGATCQSGTDCGSGNCEPAVGGGSACCTEACPNDQFCNGDSNCVSPDSDLGDACVSDADCIGGRCFDGVCCDSECDGACETCAAPGSEGRCSATAAGSTDPACPVGRQCAGRGQCLLPLGAVCSLNGDCRSGECGAALQGGGEVCCEAVCPDGQRCSPAGSCVTAPRADGNPCSTNADCLSNSCVAGRCCESACNGTCQACSGLGDCNLSPGNDSRCAPVDCPTSNTACVTYPADVTSNLCASFGACRTVQQACQPRFAAAGTACENVAPGVQGRCDGEGSCRDPRVALGVACSTGSQCASGNCVPSSSGQGLVCCGAACIGEARCSANFTACESPRRVVAEVDTGTFVSCVRFTDGGVRCWGSNSSGQLGRGGSEDIGDDELPSDVTDVDVGGRATQLAVGDGHVCAVLEGGSVRCWGRGETGSLGYANEDNIGDDELPSDVGDVPVGDDVLQVAAGGYTSCAILDGGRLRCWGNNRAGGLGYGNTIFIGDDETPSSAGDVNVGGQVLQVVIGVDGHTCAVVQGQNVRCWGRGNAGVLGYRSTLNVGDNEVPADVGFVDVGGAVVSVGAGANHTCALLSNGSVRCWGSNAGGQLGYGNEATIGDDELPSTAGDVELGGPVAQLAVGSDHNCAILRSGVVRCWGLGRNGRLGYGNVENIGDDETPLTAGAVGLRGVPIQVTAGRRHTCALLESGEVQCWGDGSSGALGYGNELDTGDTPNSTPSSLPFVSL